MVENIPEEARLTVEEIMREGLAYRTESDTIWNSSKPRPIKADEAIALKSVYERVANAQLLKAIPIIEKQAREKVIREIEEGMPDSVRNNLDWWQTLKEGK